MFGVKITVLMIVITVIMYFIAKLAVSSMSKARQLEIMINDKYPWYVYFLFVLFVIDVIGILYSVVWLLFLR